MGAKAIRGTNILHTARTGMLCVGHAQCNKFFVVIFVVTYPGFAHPIYSTNMSSQCDVMLRDMEKIDVCV